MASLRESSGSAVEFFTCARTRYAAPTPAGPYRTWAVASTASVALPVVMLRKPAWASWVFAVPASPVTSVALNTRSFTEAAGGIAVCTLTSPSHATVSACGFVWPSLTMAQTTVLSAIRASTPMTMSARTRARLIGHPR